MHKNRLGKFVRMVFLLVILIVLAVPGSPAGAQQGRFAAGSWWGTFVFSLDHSFDSPRPDLGVVFNGYSLGIENAVGSLSFEVAADGAITRSQIRFPRLEYSMIADQLIPQAELCRGYSVYASGVARISTTTPGVLQRITTDGLFTSPISLTTSTPSVEYTPVGACESALAIAAIKNSIIYDLASMIAAPWAFPADFISHNKISGTCATETWLVVNHSMQCTWQAFLFK